MSAIRARFLTLAPLVSHTETDASEYGNNNDSNHDYTHDNSNEYVQVYTQGFCAAGR